MAESVIIKSTDSNKTMTGYFLSIELFQALSHFFTVCCNWKSLFLSDQDINHINDGNSSTYLTINRTQCSHIELWADDLEITSSLEVNITGIDIRCDSTHPVISPVEVTTGSNVYGKHRECQLTAINTGNVQCRLGKKMSVSG